MAEEARELTLAERAPLHAGPRGLQLHTYDDYWRFAQAVVRSRMAPPDIDTPEKAMICLQMGAEVGLAPMASIQNIAVIKRRPVIWGDAAKGIVEASGLCDAFDEWFEGTPFDDDYKAVCEVRRVGREKPIRREFSVADAKRAGLWGKEGPWTNYPGRMLQMRARGFDMRDAFPDALKGLVIAEEAMDIPDDRRDVPPENGGNGGAPNAQTADAEYEERDDLRSDLTLACDAKGITGSQLAAMAKDLCKCKISKCGPADFARLLSVVKQQADPDAPEVDGEAKPEPETVAVEVEGAPEEDAEAFIERTACNEWRDRIRAAAETRGFTVQQVQYRARELFECEYSKCDAEQLAALLKRIEAVPIPEPEATSGDTAPDATPGAAEPKQAELAAGYADDDALSISEQFDKRFDGGAVMQFAALGGVDPKEATDAQKAAALEAAEAEDAALEAARKARKAKKRS